MRSPVPSSPPQLGRERRVLFDERTAKGERFVLDSQDLGLELHFVRAQGETFGQAIPARFGR